MINAVAIYQYADVYYEQRSDVAIVLGAGSHDGNLSPVFRERVNHALMLYNKKKIAYIIFTGGFGEAQSISDSRAAYLYALANGVPAESMMIEEKSTITYQNLVNAKQLMKDHGLTSALLVSDPLHMKRSMFICELLHIPCLPSPTKTSMYRSTNAKFRSLLYETFYYTLNQVFRR